jgi:hypothetical protein
MDGGAGTTTRRAALLALCCLPLACASSSGGDGAPDPVITSFSASPASIAAGGSTSLTAVFSGGTGSVDHGIGAVASDVPVGTGALATTTVYTLTVAGDSGATATAQATVTVVPPSVITFTTEGASFAPVIGVDGSPTILWTFHDGTTSSSPTPSKAYGSAATRHATLLVTPWSAVRRINIGYDGGDEGSAAIELVADQHVSAVQGLQLVAPSLREWCSSYNQLTSLDFSGFVQLETIEAYRSASLTRVTLKETPRLSRACFEQCGLTALDVSESPLLADLRGAVNAFPTINFGAGTFPQAWHVCTRDIPLTDRTLYASTARFPNIRYLWIWNDNQAGTLRVPSSSATGRVDIRADANAYTALDLSGALQNAAEVGLVKADANQLTSVNLDGCVQVTELYLQNNPLSAAAEDAILAKLDELGRAQAPGGTTTLLVYLAGNATPTAAGYASAQRLAAKGWTVVTTGWTVTP